MGPIVIRSFERILIILVGALSIYLGYLLFLHLPNQIDSQGRVILPGGISIYLSRIGPGAFLALFGAIVVALSFRFSIQFSSKDEKVSQEETRKTEIQYSGYSSSKASIVARDLETERSVLRMDILDHLPKLLRTNLPADSQSELDKLSSKLRIALMKDVWGPDWGEYEEFQIWVENGATEPPPRNISKAAEYYKRGAIP